MKIPKLPHNFEPTIIFMRQHKFIILVETPTAVHEYVWNGVKHYYDEINAYPKLEPSYFQ